VGVSSLIKKASWLSFRGGLHPRVAEVRDSRMLVVSGASFVAGIFGFKGKASSDAAIGG